jgi:hypothetical protein
MYTCCGPRIQLGLGPERGEMRSGASHKCGAPTPLQTLYKYMDIFNMYFKNQISLIYYNMFLRHNILNISVFLYLKYEVK